MAVGPEELAGKPRIEAPEVPLGQGAEIHPAEQGEVAAEKADHRHRELDQPARPAEGEHRRPRPAANPGGTGDDRGGIGETRRQQGLDDEGALRPEREEGGAEAPHRRPGEILEQGAGGGEPGGETGDGMVETGERDMDQPMRADLVAAPGERPHQVGGAAGHLVEDEERAADAARFEEIGEFEGERHAPPHAGRIETVEFDIDGETHPLFQPEFRMAGQKGGRFHIRGGSHSHENGSMNHTPDAPEAALEAEIAHLIVEVLHLENKPEDIDPEAPLFGEGLGLDSIDALELALALSRSYGIELKSDDERNREIFASLRALARFVGENRIRG